MKFKVVVPLLLVGTAILALGLFFPGAQPVRASPAPFGGEDVFDPVWAIMDSDPSVGGCRGCHVGKKPGVGFWYGNDKESVLMTLETGINPNGEELGFIPVEGGRASWLAWYLYSGVMPLEGTPWNDEQFALLDAWLVTYEPPDYFEPVWQIMNNMPGNAGCVGCHIREGKIGTGPWFGWDKDSVLNTLVTGVTPDGQSLVRIPVEGGTEGRMANFLRTGFMPRGGRRWVQEELDVLYQWLVLFK